MIAVQVVVKSVVDGRADGEFDAREQVLDRLGHDVGRRMADGVEPFFAVGSDEFDGRVFHERVAQILVLAIDNCQQGLLAQFLVQAFGDFEERGARREFPRAAVFQSDIDVCHDNSSYRVMS